MATRIVGWRAGPREQWDRDAVLERRAALVGVDLCCLRRHRRQERCRDNPSGCGTVARGGGARRHQPSAPMSSRKRDAGGAVAHCTGKVSPPSPSAIPCTRQPRMYSSSMAIATPARAVHRDSTCAPRDFGSLRTPLANDVSEQFIHPRIRETHVRSAWPCKAASACQRQADCGDGNDGGANTRPATVGAIAEEAGLLAAPARAAVREVCRTSPSLTIFGCASSALERCFLQTAKPVLDVAVACGFASASHFSRCYRAEYGRKPSHERVAVLTAAQRVQETNGNRGRRR